MAERKILPNTKESKGVGKALINALGFLSLLFGSLILLGIIFQAIGSIFFLFFPKTKSFQFKRVKMDEDNNRGKPESKTKV